MSIERSGFYQTTRGESFLVTQGLVGNTLVAGKQVLLRLFLDPSVIVQVDYCAVRIERVGTGSKTGLVAPLADLIIAWDAPNGPSVGIILRGFAFPQADTYAVSMAVGNAQGGVLARVHLEPFVFHPTKDLRFLVVYGFHEGFFAPTLDWTADVARSMERLGSMFPVRDCVQSALNGNKRSGIRYTIGNACDGWTSGYYDCVYGQTQAINGSAGDDIDVTIEFRWGFYPPEYNPPGDPNPGGNSGPPPAPYGGLRRAACVAGPFQGIEMTAPCFAQEIGHNFGLEPAASPHFQDSNDPGHSKDPHLFDPFAYDFVNHRPYNPPPPGRFLGDTMNNLGGGVWQGADDVLFNAFDWEYLRQRLMTLDSTGTEVNPSLAEACGPFLGARPVPRSPAEWTGIIAGQADGPLITWGPHGIIVNPPPIPDTRRGTEGLRAALHEFARDHINAVYVPFANEHLTITVPSGAPSLHHAHFTFGGKEQAP